jgi:hypothetical protein
MVALIVEKDRSERMESIRNIPFMLANFPSFGHDSRASTALDAKATPQTNILIAAYLPKCAMYISCVTMQEP